MCKAQKVFCTTKEKYHHHPVSSQVQLIDPRNLSLEEIRAYLRDFPFDKFVIKPSGAINPAIKVAKPDKRLSAVPGSKMQDQLLPD
jgi:hypothetical protein